jgi:hypothetical protein
VNIEEFYVAIRHKFEPETFAEANEEVLTYGTKRYIKLFRTKGHKSLFISRNIPAIFLGPLWFLYRRMYVFAFVFPAIWFGIEYIIRRYSSSDIVVDCFELVFSIYVSLFANSLYINNTRRRFAKGLNSSPSRRSVCAGVVGVVLCGIGVLVVLKMYFIMNE